MEAAKSPEAIVLRIGDDLTLTLRSGERLIDICDRSATPISFSCRSGSCGTCAIRVLQGMANLSPLNEKEEIVIADLEAPDPHIRLACQVRIFGDSHIQPL
jgi:ferredoxin